MTNSQLLILLLVLLAGYWAWLKQAKTKSNPPSPSLEPLILEEPQPLISFPLAQLPENKKDWFSDQRWLSDQEIDWALEQILSELPTEQANQYKFLESTQFMFAKEALATKDPDATFSFPVFLSELTGFSGELVFIPVNNPDFHWSLLVYETKAKKFTHYDTLKGANYHYIKPLVSELLTQLLSTNQPDLTKHLVKKHDIRQGNTYDCGIALIEITKRITKLWNTFTKNSPFNLTKNLGQFDFPQRRKQWRKQLENYD